MALRITGVKPLFLVRAGMQLKDMPDVHHWKEDLKKASLMGNMQLKFPYQMPPLKCSNLTTLLLSKCSIESIPDGFFEQMHGLKILDLSDNSIKSLPDSISNLKTLTTLLLAGCKSLEKVPSMSKLEGLKKLDMSRTKIRHIPDGMEKLINLKYLDLYGTWIHWMDKGILAKLTSLRYLSLINFVKFGDILEKGEEIGGLRKLEILEARFGVLNELNSYAQALKTPIRLYNIFVGEKLRPHILQRWGKLIKIYGYTISCAIGIKILSDVEQLIIDSCTVRLCGEVDAFFSRFIPVPYSNTFSSLSRITIWNCGNINKLFSSNWALNNLQNLSSLSVKSCKEMEEIIGSDSEEGITSTLPKLRSLILSDLQELKSICGVNGVMVCDSIEFIIIRNCPKLKRISLKLPLQNDGQPCPPPSLQSIYISAQDWSQLEWDHPNAKSLLQPYVRC